ncbi:MAG TPA: hypothetical protein VKB72_13105, partial [Steroidobacteraceae bacterium]|nr:hypothetical protein [Steroidobacteraceae bacterium]
LLRNSAMITFLLKSSREFGDGAAVTQDRRVIGPRRCLAVAPRATVSSVWMGISQPQNLRTPPIEKLRPYGIRVSLPVGDPFRKLLGPDWQRLHWYPTPAERDAAMAEMSRRHEYSRAGDRPALIFQKIEKLAESRGL